MFTPGMFRVSFTFDVYYPVNDILETVLVDRKIPLVRDTNLQNGKSVHASTEPPKHKCESEHTTAIVKEDTYR